MGTSEGGEAGAGPKGLALAMGTSEDGEPGAGRKVSDELLKFVRERGGSDAPRYAAQMRKIFEVQQKQRRATDARRHYKQRCDGALAGGRKAKQPSELQQKQRDPSKDNAGEATVSGRLRTRSHSRDISVAPCDRCGRRRRRRGLALAMGTPEDQEEAGAGPKVSDELLKFVRKRSGTDAPRYAAQLCKMFEVQQKQRRAANARRHYKRRCDGPLAGGRKAKQSSELQQKQRDPSKDNAGDVTLAGRLRTRSRSRDTSVAPCDRCGRRRRRRCGRRRRSRCRRRRRRSRCRRRRRSRCRRRRRSRCRRRRRRSCRRRRRQCRRRRRR